MAENVLGHQQLFGLLTCAASTQLDHEWSENGNRAVEWRDAVSRSTRWFSPELAEMCPGTASLLISSVRFCYKIPVAAWGILN